MPRFGCVNVHASLSPKYWCSPIQWAVLNRGSGHKASRPCMDEGLDTGDMIMKQEVIVDEDETGGSLFDKLSGVGAKLLREKRWEAIENGTAVYTPQDDATCNSHRKDPERDGSIDWSKMQSDQSVWWLNPWPSAYTRIDDKT